ncbi:MAG TPA: hypothetical protein VIV34_11590 [Pseudolabrys sp.]
MKSKALLRLVSTSRRLSLSYRSIALVGSAGIFIAASSVTGSASTLLSDSTFGGVIVATGHSGDPLGTATGGFCSACGTSSSAGLSVIVDYSASSSASNTLSDVGVVDHSLSYDPTALGAIASINASYNRELRTNYSINVPLNFRLVLEQGGVDYVTAINLGGSDTGGAFHHLSVSGLIATSFSSFNFSTGVGGSAHPNFSSGPMLFGVMALTNEKGGQVTESFYDDINISVNQTPLPAALPLFATGLGGLGLLGWRRKKKAVAVTA